MITKEKIKVFKYYKGEVDAFGHGSKRDRKNMSDNEFLLLANLAQDIKLVRKTNTSDLFQANLQDKLKANFDTEETIEEFKTIVLLLR